MSDFGAKHWAEPCCGAEDSARFASAQAFCTAPVPGALPQPRDPVLGHPKAAHDVPGLGRGHLQLLGSTRGCQAPGSADGTRRFNALC